tara:strand:+ start:2408 stop:2611 length:204 start_codon:yes stop_codon:yes gene_type:complete
LNPLTLPTSFEELGQYLILFFLLGPTNESSKKLIFKIGDADKILEFFTLKIPDFHDIQSGEGSPVSF